MGYLIALKAPISEGFQGWRVYPAYKFTEHAGSGQIVSQIERAPKSLSNQGVRALKDLQTEEDKYRAEIRLERAIEQWNPCRPRAWLAKHGELNTGTGLKRSAEFREIAREYVRIKREAIESVQARRKACGCVRWLGLAG
jgi:hypothetical protein